MTPDRPAWRDYFARRRFLYGDPRERLRQQQDDLASWMRLGALAAKRHSDAVDEPSVSGSMSED